MIEMTNLLSAKPESSHRRLIYLTGVLLFLSFSGLYLVLPIDLASQPWDSLDYAYSTEVNGIKMMRGNHPLGHFILSTIFWLTQQLGYDGRALSVFQIFNSILGGVIIGIFFAMLVLLIKVKPFYALGLAVIIGASHSFWFFAGTGDIYHFAILSLLCFWIVLVYEVIVQGRRYPFVSGILAGLSVLFHQLNAVLLPIGVALILLTPATGMQTKEVKIRQVAAFAASAALTIVLGYLILGYIVTSTLSPAWIIGWMRGYLGDPTYGRYLNTRFLETALDAVSQRVIFSSLDGASFTIYMLLASLFMTMPLGFVTRKVHGEKKQAVMHAAFLECLVTWLLILWWEPQNPKFWLLTLIPSCIFLAISFEGVEKSVRNWLPRPGRGMSRAMILLPLVAGVIVFSINLQNLDDDQDAAAFDEALDIWMNSSNPNDVLITAGDLVPHLRYWGYRPNTVNLFRSLQDGQSSPDDFYKLREMIEQALCTHRKVLITPAASDYIPDDQLSLVGVSRSALRAFLEEEARKGKIVFWYRNSFDDKLLPVYALQQAEVCSDQKALMPREHSHLFR